jgi:hypothetical protein
MRAHLDGSRPGFATVDEEKLIPPEEMAEEIGVAFAIIRHPPSG